MADPTPAGDKTSRRSGLHRTDASRMSTGSQIAVATINTLPQFAWPVLVALLLIFFWTPLTKMVNDAADLIADGGASVEVPGLKISLPKRAVPVPLLAVKEVLTKLDSDLVNFIIGNVGGHNTLDICYPESDPKELTDTTSVSNRLRGMGLISFVQMDQIDKDTGKPCPGGSRTLYTPLYDATRDYLISIIKLVTFRNLPTH